MTTKLKARCGIYESRPDVCIQYPKVDSYMPPDCTYTFVGSERRGECDCGTGSCCAVPRMNGEPGAPAVPEAAGGMPCKHLIWIDVEDDSEKSAAGYAETADDTKESIKGLLDVIERL